MAATGCSQRSLHVLALTAAGVGGAAYMSRRCCTTHDDGNDDDGQDSGGVVTIAGYGSLMDEQSARATTPSIRNWRWGYVEGYARIFNLVSIINIKRGHARGRKLATCTARRRLDRRLYVCLYDVPAQEYPQLLARERRLRETRVTYTGHDGASGMAHMFTEYSDAEYRAERATSAALWHSEVGQFYSGERIYREDLLPVPNYLERCLLAYGALGAEALRSFVTNSFLGDGRTSIAQYLASQPDAWGAAAHYAEQQLPV